jgi:UDPglucose 6-dehydrogenase
MRIAMIGVGYVGLAPIRSLLREPVMIDLRNIYRPQEVRDVGFRCVSIGRE